MAKALVTGGAGFVGSRLVETLIADGHEVFVIDNLSTGSLANLSSVSDSPLLHVVVDSITRREVLEELVAQVDVIYHLAASVGVKLIVSKLVDSIENNIQGTEAVLQLADKYKKRVLLTSTSEVYGRSNDAPFAETDDLKMGPTLKTRWSYACSKALDEYLAFAYYHERKLPVTVVRLFNTVGERQTDAYGMVLPSFVKQALRGEPLTIYGDGSQSRCFCHVDDVVLALRGLMDHPAAVGEVYNIGSTEEISINELADRVIALTGSTSLKTHLTYEQAYTVGFDDISRRVPNIGKIHSLLGWQPSSSVNDIIVKITEAFRATELATTTPATLVQS